MRFRSCIPFLLLFPALTISFVGCTRSDSGLGPSGEGLWTISGTTYLAGSTNPLSGVLVKCAGLSSMSGSDGRYEIRGVPGGTQLLTAEKAGCDAYSSPLEVNGDVTHYVYLGFKSTNLSGYVTNAIDGPIKGAKVVLGSLFYYTDISGRYELITAPRGTDSLYVVHPSYLEFKTAISLTAQEMAFDAILKRDSVFQGGVRAFNYVDQASPTLYWPRFPNYQFLYLRANGYDSAGVYHDRIERSILVRFDFPGFLADERVSLLEASLEMCINGPHLPFNIKTYAITSIWTYSVTYNTQPPIGSLLFSSTIGDASLARYWTVLGTDGVRVLLADYRANGITYGFEIKGGTTDSVGIYSSRSTQNQPKMTFKVRF